MVFILTHHQQEKRKQGHLHAPLYSPVYILILQKITNNTKRYPGDRLFHRIQNRDKLHGKHENMSVQTISAVYTYVYTNI